MIRKLKNTYHLLVAMLANIVYGSPSKKIKVIGVTGTDGKTTTTSLIYHILKTAGKKVSMVSTVYAKVGEKEYDTGFHVSTPHSFTVQRFLKESVENGDEFFIMESTSHAFDQNRVFGVEYQIGVITNITHEHLDYHKTYEAYVHAKAKLLHQSKIRIINRDDQSYDPLLKELSPSEKVISYGLKQGDIIMDLASITGLKLPEFNKYNYLAAYVVTTQAGLDEKTIVEAMKSFTLPPGRMELIQEEPYTYIVDFAHTPQSVKVALQAVHDEYLRDGGRLIHIFGCAAKRDEAKRPLMGYESGKQADLTIITEEDYRDEDPNKIAKEIAAGLEKAGMKEVPPEEFGSAKKQYTILNDRRQALEKAISIAGKNDVIISTGKGHEKSLAHGSSEDPWDEQATVKELLQKYSK